MDWAACACILCGIEVVGRKKRLGFLIICVGAALTGIIVGVDGHWGIVTQEVAVVVMNIRGWWKWRPC